VWWRYAIVISPFTHGHRITAAGAGWLREQEHGESASALGPAIAKPFKLAALLRGAGDVHLKVTMADYDGAARRFDLRSAQKRRARTLMWLPFKAPVQTGVPRLTSFALSLDHDLDATVMILVGVSERRL
jgi:hypothetical protein